VQGRVEAIVGRGWSWPPWIWKFDILLLTF